MTEYKVTHHLSDVQVDDSVVLTPKQERAVIAKFNAAIEREIYNALAAGYYVVNHIDNRGRTFEHQPRRKLLTNQGGDP